MPKKKIINEEPEFTKDTPILTENPLMEEVKKEEPVKPSVSYRVERAEMGGVLPPKNMPDIIGGVCEFCGAAKYDNKGRVIEDYRVNPKTLEGNCPHYKGVQIKCSYCPASSNWEGNINSRRHNVREWPEGSGKLIVFCDALGCADTHYNRFIKERKS